MILALQACKLGPSAGKRCQTGGTAVCTGKSGELLCTSGTWTAIACKGPGGCDSSGPEVACDDNLAEVGDGCRMPDVASEKNWACSLDKTKQLVCASGKFTVSMMCRGPHGCSVHGQTVDCDNSIAAIDDACDQDGDFACATDGKLELTCRGGKFVANDACRGPKGCRVGKDAVDCDDSLAMAGDPCTKSESESHVHTCSVDGSEELVCHATRWERSRGCAHKRCSTKGDTLECN